MSSRFLSIIFLFGLCLASLVLAAPLPRGKGYQPLKSTKVEVAESVCDFGIIRGRRPDLLFRPATDELLLFSGLPGKGQAKEALILLDIETFEIRKVLSLSRKKNHVMVHLKPDLSVINLVNFSTHRHCWWGKASVLSLNLAGKIGARVTLRDGHYGVVEGVDRRYIVSGDDYYFRVIHAKSFQVRKGKSFPKGDIPLYRDGNQLLSMRLKEKQRFLVDMNIANGNPGKLTKVPQGSILMHIMPGFLLMRYSGLNSIEFSRFGNYSARVLPQKISLPRAYSLKLADIYFNKARSVGVVFQKDPRRTKRWSKAFVFDLLRGDLLGDVKVPSGHYVSHHFFDEKRNRLVLLFTSHKSRALALAKTLDLKLIKWKAHQLTVR